MFERFTESSRKVVVLAQREADLFHHNYVGTEHLLLGLLREDEGVAAQTLNALGVTLDEVREQVESIVGYGEEGTGGQAPFTPRSKKVLELALREALQLGHNYIGTEHILLGLAQVPQGVANRMLSNLDVESDEVYEEVLRGVGEATERSPEDYDYTDSSIDMADGILFRGCVNSLKIDMRFAGRTNPWLLDLEYVYAVQDTADTTQAVDPDDLVAKVTEVFDGRDLDSLEDEISSVGHYVLSQFPTVREVKVTIIRLGENGRRTMPEIKVLGTTSR